MNIALMEKLRCMLIHSKLPKTFWAEALNIACYLVNRSPSTIIGCKTPIERWSEYLAVKQGKLEPRALRCKFLGYPDGVKAYRLWCVDVKPLQCIVSRDIPFNESEILTKSRNFPKKKKMINQ